MDKETFTSISFRFSCRVQFSLSLSLVLVFRFSNFYFLIHLCEKVSILYLSTVWMHCKALCFWIVGTKYYSLLYEKRNHHQHWAVAAKQRDRERKICCFSFISYRSERKIPCTKEVQKQFLPLFYRLLCLFKMNGNSCTKEKMLNCIPLTKNQPGHLIYTSEASSFAGQPTKTDGNLKKQKICKAKMVDKYTLIRSQLTKICETFFEQQKGAEVFEKWFMIIIIYYNIIVCCLHWWQDLFSLWNENVNEDI